MDPTTTQLLDRALAGDGLVTVLTGAGISAASGIPTFRGPEGYWTVGAREHTPQHLRAGSTPGRTYPVHGEIEWVRCAEECTAQRQRIPAAVRPKARGEALTADDRAALRCPRCGGWLRPHVLWFDETYDEPRFRFDSALRGAGRTALLLTVGTAGATTLPMLVAQRAAATGATLVDVNTDDNPFAALAGQTGGAVVRRPATDALPDLVDTIIGRPA